MKWSRYNILFLNKKGEYFLYNSRLNSFFNLDRDTYTTLKRMEESKELDALPEKQKADLAGKKILVEDREDDDFVVQMKYLKRKKTFTGNNLGIVLAPTLACNFKCPYCYEKDLPNVFISNEVQDKLIQFINLQENKAKQLSLYWHGGEPLLAFKEIRSIIDKIQEKSVLPLVDHRMVTNGYLFNKEMCKFFNDTHLQYVQITVDGKEATHNSNRIHKSGQPTYQKIIDNIDMIVEEMPSCLVGVRVNIHNGNKDDYPEIYNHLSQRWKGKNCTVYPAFVLPQSNGCNVSCLSSKEKPRFYMDLYTKHGMKNLDFKPRMQLGSCSAIYENHYVIDPQGTLFKCWADFGMPERAIGNLDEGITNWKFVAEYAMNSDKFVDQKCLNCPIFPICDGGCNRFRVDNALYGIPYDVCPIEENGLIGYLNIIYENSMMNKEE